MVENLNFLQIVQEVFKTIREPKATSLSSQNARTQEVVQAVKDIYLEVCSLNNGHLSFLEGEGEITLATDTREYDMADDIKYPNREGWFLGDGDGLNFMEYNSFVEKFKDKTESGKPYNFTFWGGKVFFGFVPSAEYNGKKVRYPYWKQPADINNDDDVPLLPKEFRRRVLVFGAAAQLLQSDADSSFKLYWDRYMGGIEDLKRGYASMVPEKARVTYVF